MKKIFYLVTLVIFSLLFVQCEEEPDGKGVHEGHEFVDLGLPSGLKWAAYNVGAESPEQSGDYFAWGEVEPKSYYFWNTYKYSGDKDSTFTKYCTDTLCGLNGFVDNKLQLDIEDDAAHVNWGGNWRMPTAKEAQELYDYCKWTWTTQNGIPGYKVMGINGNSIFLPAVGSIGWDKSYDLGEEGVFWTSSLSGPDFIYSNSPVFLRLIEKDIAFNIVTQRCWGFSVRAVCP